MKKLIIVLPLALIILVPITLSTTHNTHVNYPNVLNSFPVLPGMVNPLNSSCGKSYIYYANYCHIGKDIIYQTDVSNHVTEINYWILSYNIPIGQFMLKFGDPIGISKPSNHIWSLYWQDKRVWVIGKEFNPYTPIAFIEFSNQDRYFEKWQGFKQ